MCCADSSDDRIEKSPTANHNHHNRQSTEGVLSVAVHYIYNTISSGHEVRMSLVLFKENNISYNSNRKR